MRWSSLVNVGRASTLILGLGCLGFGVVSATPPAPGRITKKKIEFNRDVRPAITKCFTCHGHDSAAVMAGLRLDTFDTATAKLRSGNRAIVPGHPEQSELITRINATDPDDLMPPSDSNKTLSAEEKAILKQWILEGAEYKPHWAFVPPVRPTVPPVKLKSWVRSPIDAFILARLEEEGGKPASEADKLTLLRRVTLDVTGLPPTATEIANFTQDRSPDAYEKVVDRLLASPRYGERMAMDWMDYARYADSNGYQADYERFQYRWRDWVIDAFNQNMPYDQFTVEQLAGDLLPHPTLNQIIATGFNRNHRINTEGGVIPEEWRVETVIDRVETTSATWLGLTTGCARCHDHKYDPVSQKEFYSLFAYFNNVPESGTGEERPVNHPPFISAPYPAQAARTSALVAEMTSLRIAMNARLNANRGSSAKWTLSDTRVPEVESGRIARYVLESRPRVLGSSDAPKPSGDVKFSSGRVSGAVATSEKGFLDLGNVGDFDSNSPFSYSLWINPNQLSGSPISRMDSSNDFRGWDLFIAGGRPMVHLISKWPENALKVVSRQMLPAHKWSHIVVSYDGSAKPEGIKIYIDGKPSAQDVEVNALEGSIKTPVSAKIGRRTTGDFFDGLVDDVSLYSRALTAKEADELSRASEANILLKIPEDQRTPDQKKQLTQLWSKAHDAKYRDFSSQLDSRTDEYRKLQASVSSVMIMKEMVKPRPAYVLVRGQYDKHGDEVKPAVPKFLPPLPKGAPNNRLGLAEWIVSPENPLTARVTVNRMWERLFGTGIVETSEDFGTRASFPTHPELLDWLATEFVAKAWNLKAMMKELLMSATYRQSSDHNAWSAKHDPENKLLSRGPRFRLPGEVLRDQALAAAGLLKEKIGGPSVRPYQPDGVWDELNVYGNLRNYKHDKGDNLYRRSLYTIWKRTAAPPDMTLFDVPTRETCRVRRSRTNTPLQALAMLNDVTYVEAARALAERMIREGGSSPAKRLKVAYLAVLGRAPNASESTIHAKALSRDFAHYRQHPDEARKLLSEGDSPVPGSLDKSELAAYTITASTILNLDEAITKE
jgi:hypothetical protein